MMDEEAHVSRTGTKADDDRLEAYLLGRLEPAEAEAFEDEVFTEAARFERLQIVEEALLEAYAQGTLDSETRRAVEDRLLHTPEGRLRLQVTRALERVGEAAPPAGAPARGRAWRWALGLALGFAGLISAVLLLRTPVLATVTLAPDTLRSPGAPAQIECGAHERLRLVLELDGLSPPTRPRVRIEAAGFAIERSARVRGDEVWVEVPTEGLPAGTVTVRVLEAAASPPDLVSVYSLALACE